MLNFNASPKRATNLSLNAKVLDTARELGMNVSQTVDALLADAVRARYWQQWEEQNRDAIAAYNQRVTEQGTPLAQYRSWGRQLDDTHGAV